jgi:hypothetical protein
VVSFRQKTTGRPNLSGTDLSGADLGQAKLQGATITTEQLNVVILSFFQGSGNPSQLSKYLAVPFPSNCITDCLQSSQDGEGDSVNHFAMPRGSLHYFVYAYVVASGGYPGYRLARAANNEAISFTLMADHSSIMLRLLQKSMLMAIFKDRFKCANIMFPYRDNFGDPEDV